MIADVDRSRPSDASSNQYRIRLAARCTLYLFAMYVREPKGKESDLIGGKSVFSVQQSTVLARENVNHGERS